MAHYGLNSYQRKNRDKARRRFFIQLFFVMGIAVVAGFAYHFGERQMAARVNQRMDEVKELTTERDSLRKQVVDLQAGDLVNQQKITELEGRYTREIPDEAHAGLVRLLREKIAGGVTIERMTTLLSAASNPRHCRGRESKRFMLSTSLNQGTNSSATFASGAVTVSGDGQTMMAADGKPESWYDALKPVSMKFRLIGGHVSLAEGVLPLQHSLIDDETEYRFTIEAGPRGFVVVTGDSCDYPGPVATPPAPASSPASVPAPDPEAGSGSPPASNTPEE